MTLPKQVGYRVIVALRESLETLRATGVDTRVKKPRDISNSISITRDSSVSCQIIIRSSVGSFEKSENDCKERLRNKSLLGLFLLVDEVVTFD